MYNDEARNFRETPEFGDKIIIKTPVGIIESRITHMMTQHCYHEENDPDPEHTLEECYIHTSFRYYGSTQ